MANQIAPTKNNLLSSKKSLELSQMGYDLMDKKKNILIKEIVSMTEKSKEIRTALNETLLKAYSSLEMVYITTGDVDAKSDIIPIDDNIDINFIGVMGVELANITINEKDKGIYYGFNYTNSYFDEAYILFNEAKKLIIELAQIESRALKLTEAIKKTQKRTNALSNITIPKLTETIKYISNAIDEKEREDFSRLKVIKNIKK